MIPQFLNSPVQHRTLAALKQPFYGKALFDRPLYYSFPHFVTLPLLASILIFSGCATLFGTAELDQSRVKIIAKEAKIVERRVLLSDLKNALGDELKTVKLRAVEVFQSASGLQPNFRHYRLFDIYPGSVYELLGLQNADILIAINERSVVSPQVIGQIVRLLPNEKGVTFEVMREGKSLALKIQFVN